jgi:hypothetical protein
VIDTCQGSRSENTDEGAWGGREDGEGHLGEERGRERPPTFSLLKESTLSLNFNFGIP